MKTESNQELSIVNRIVAITELVDAQLAKIISALGPVAEEKQSSYEIWNLSDALAHCAHWLETDFRRIETPDQIIELLSQETVEDINRDVYSRHAGKGLGLAREYFSHTLNRVSGLAQQLGESGLNSTLKYSDARERPVWRSLGGHSGLHVSWHFGIILMRHGQNTMAVQMAEELNELSITLGSDPLWQSAHHYDLAGCYARAQFPEKALASLSQAIELNPTVKQRALSDDDFALLHSQKYFIELTN